MHKQPQRTSPELITQNKKCRVKIDKFKGIGTTCVGISLVHYYPDPDVPPDIFRQLRHKYITRCAAVISECMCLIDTNHGSIASPVVDLDVSWCCIDSFIVDRDVTEPGTNSVRTAFGAVSR